jgi:hypothetical protein
MRHRIVVRRVTVHVEEADVVVGLKDGVDAKDPAYQSIMIENMERMGGAGLDWRPSPGTSQSSVRVRYSVASVEQVEG